MDRVPEEKLLDWLVVETQVVVELGEVEGEGLQLAGLVLGAEVEDDGQGFLPHLRDHYGRTRIYNVKLAGEIG